LDKKFKKKGN